MLFRLADRASHRSTPRLARAGSGLTGLAVTIAIASASVFLPARAADTATRYSGQLTCAECGDRPAALELRQDGTYRLRLAATGSGKTRQPATDEVGRWRNDAEPAQITLSGSDSGGVRVLALQPDGTPAGMKAAPAAASIEPRLTLRGEWRDGPGGATYTDCRSGQSLAVLPSAATKQAVKAVKAVREQSGLDDGAAVIVTGTGRQLRAGRTQPEGAEVLAVDKFDNAWPAERCEVAFDEPSLVDTRWTLTRVRSLPVVPAGSERDAHIVLQPLPPAPVPGQRPEPPPVDERNPGLLPNPLKPPSRDAKIVGSTGCNRLLGIYRVRDDQIIFAPGLGTTRMACPPGPAADVEQAFGEALQFSSRFHVTGGHLEIFDDAGKLLLRFRAER
jgi:hypothetical protein